MRALVNRYSRSQAPARELRIIPINYNNNKIIIILNEIREIKHFFYQSKEEIYKIKI